MGALARRILFVPVVLVIVTVVIYGGLRILRPDLHPGDPLLGGILHDLDRALLHLDFGCAPPGGPGSTARPSGHCIPVRTLWQQGMAADVWLLAGALVIGPVAGILGGLWCVGHPRKVLAKALQAGAALAYCAPVYFVGLALLYLFHPVIGVIHLPGGFFDAEPSWASPFTDPWTWLRTLLVPWLVLAAPLAGMCLRLTLASASEITHEDYVRTAVAKGLPTNMVLRRHVGRPTFGATVSFAPVTLPLFLTNVMLVERVFSVPGFFQDVWKAIGHNGQSAINLPIIILAALWTTVLVIVLSTIADAILSRLDPRVRGTAF